MNAQQVSLEVVSPCSFYCNHYDKKDFFAQMSQSLNKFANSKINGLTMSLDALAFPGGFPQSSSRYSRTGPLSSRNTKYDIDQLTSDGRKVCDASAYDASLMHFTTLHSHYLRNKIFVSQQGLVQILHSGPFLQNFEHRRPVQDTILPPVPRSVPLILV